MSVLLEDCAQGLFSALQHEGGCPSCIALAERLGLSLASTAEMVEDLARLGLVRCEPHGPLALTRTGHKVAFEVIRHRRVLEAELARAQGLSGRFPAGQADGDGLLSSVGLEKRSRSIGGRKCSQSEG